MEVYIDLFVFFIDNEKTKIQINTYNLKQRSRQADRKGDKKTEGL